MLRLSISDVTRRFRGSFFLRLTSYSVRRDPIFHFAIPIPSDGGASIAGSFRPQVVLATSF
jgi:hypothetical protein